MGESLVAGMMRYLEFDSIVKLGSVSNNYLFESLYALKYNRFMPSSKIDDDNIDVRLFGLPDIGANDESKLKQLVKLIKMGANINAIHGSALSSALSEDISLQYVEILLKNGADVNIQDDIDEMTPLMSYISGERFIEYENTDIMKLLLKYGADVNIKEKDGNTALMLLISYYSESGGIISQYIPLLLEHGADPSIKNDKQESALDLMSENAARLKINYGLYPRTIIADFIISREQGKRHKYKNIENRGDDGDKLLIMADFHDFVDAAQAIGYY